MEDFWKDDYRPLRWAGKVVLQALRDDENAPDADLYRRLTQSNENAHLYFQSDSTLPFSALGSPGIRSSSSSTPYNQSAALSPPTIALKHRQSLPLPAVLTDALKQVRTCSFMGLLLPVGMAWMTVDEKLFLFSADDPSQGSIQCFENPRKQPFLAVALVKPKQGIFKDVIEWCLVLTTPEEVMLVALARMDENLTMIPTSFLTASDLVLMTCAVGTDNGRIFLGGDDGCVHEMTYEDGTADEDYYNGLSNRTSIEAQLDEFYDGNKVLPDVVNPSSFPSVSDVVWNVSKRSLRSISTSLDDGPRKCRKLNRTTQASSIATSLVPNAIRRLSSVVFGVPSSQNGGRVTRLVVDSQRQTLYSLSEKGWISVFDIGQPDAAPCIAVCDVPKTLRLYLEAVSRGQMFPPVSNSSTVGLIHFPGGGSGAQAGVGGMEGARNILKQIDWQQNVSSKRDQLDQSISKQPGAHPMVTPVAVHVIHLQESSRLTLMAVTGGGLRLYFSALSSSVLSSGPSSLSNGNRLRSFGSKLTLCHIRSPPPSNLVGMKGDSRLSADIVGGILPHVSGSNSSVVDATYYQEGQWVFAIQDRVESPGCDVMVAVTPDISFRPREGGEGKLILDASGGLSESVSFPIAATHEKGQDGRVTLALSGGLVWEIGSDDRENSSSMDLLTHSPTPSNNELEAGLPPIYYPPSLIRREVIDDKNTTTGENRSLVPASVFGRSRALQVMMNVIYSNILGRPLDYGFNHQQTSFSGEHNQPVYRISKRAGLKGFSLSASERRTPGTSQRSRGAKKSQATNHTKSARLQTWLLRPPPQSLNQLTKQHLLTGKKVVTAINVQGVHKFEFITILSSLADALADAGDNVADDARITSFFTGYGYKEGCAMCLALAIGCGPSQQMIGNSDAIRRRATTAALARAFKPRLAKEEQRVNSLPSSFTSSNATDRCVPPGYVFCPSALSEGLFSLVSRLLRPIWHKPLVVVTEGRSIKMRWGTGTSLTSAKVELLLDGAALEEILAPLQALHFLLRTDFSRAIDAVPGTLGQQPFAMDIDGGPLQHQQQYFTQALQYHSQFRNSSGDSVANLSPKECDNFAYLLEERNIHSIYRLVALVIQLLRVHMLLRKSEATAGLPKTNWGLLHGVTVSDTVQSAEGHDRVETLLNEWIVSSASSSTPPLLSTQVNHLADQLAEQCFLFFPPSSRFTYQGLLLANQALSHPPGSLQRKESGKHAASQLLHAARHWHSASLISGREVGGNGKQTYAQIAGRAIKHSSPLATAAELLMKLEDVSSVVEICLTTAQNFKSLSIPLGSKDVLRYDGMLGWEADLYHKQVGTIELETSSNGPQHNTSSEIYGPLVAAKDAIETCHALIFVHLDQLLRSNRPLADRMVSACCAEKDKSFLKSLFTFLIDSSNVQTLLRIDSPEAEAFLREQNDPNLLWRYYSVLEKFAEAGRVAFDCATSDNIIPLGDRIEWLTKALHSFRSAQSSYRSSGSSISDDELTKCITQTEDSLRIATVQDRVVRRIESLNEFPQDIDPSRFEELKTNLFEATPLYNDFVAVVPLFDLCLVMFHMCRHDDPPTIKNLWKNAFCEEILPCCTKSPTIFRALGEFTREVDLADRVTYWGDTAEIADMPVFEDGNWVVPVHDMVVRLGHELYGSGADYAFPFDYILEQLELLRCMLGSNLAFGWPLTTMAEAGVPYLFILDAYENIADLENSTVVDPRKTLEHISASLELFMFWISNSRAAGPRAGQHSIAQIELSRSMSTGDLMPKLNLLRSRLEQIQGTRTPLLERLDGIEDSISLLVSM